MEDVCLGRGPAHTHTHTHTPILSIYCIYLLLWDVTMPFSVAQPCPVHIMTAYGAMTPRLRVWPECVPELRQRMFIQPVCVCVCVCVFAVKKTNLSHFCGRDVRVDYDTFCRPQNRSWMRTRSTFLG